MRIIGNDQKNNGQNLWEILESKISSIIGAGLLVLSVHSPSTYYVWVYPLKHKSEVFDPFLQWKAMVKKAMIIMESKGRNGQWA